jgi:glycine cleavage system regulatory protein
VNQTSLILTVVGPDRPGLVRLIAQSVAERGGTWLESRMARLAGQFAGIVLVAVPPAEVEPLAATLRALSAEGLRVAVERGSEEAAPPPPVMLALEVIGNDRPGIVRDVTRVLAECSVNIEELTTDVKSGSFSGEPLFRAAARISAPSPGVAAKVKSALEHLGNELMVDIHPEA